MSDDLCVRNDSSPVRLFNFSRIPLPGSDAFSAPAPNALHTTLIIDDFYYSVDIFAPSSSGEHPEPLEEAEIERRFRAAVEDAKSRRDKGELAPPVGVLSGDERDTWTKVGPKTDDFYATPLRCSEPRAPYLTIT
jgi:carnitine O-acetyltransferase